MARDRRGFEINFGGPDPFAQQNQFMPIPGLGGLHGGPPGAPGPMPGSPFGGGAGVPQFGLQEALGGGTFDPTGTFKGADVSGGGEGGGGFLGKIGSFLKDNPDLILGVAAIVDNARRQSKMDKQRQEVLDDARARQEETAPLRSHALQQLMEPVNKDVDLTEEFADASNPFARRR